MTDHCPHCQEPVWAVGPARVCAGCGALLGSAESARLDGAEVTRSLEPASAEAQIPSRATALESHPSDAPASPSLAGRYSVLETLGRGGCGLVYKARDNELDRLVAIKVALAGRRMTEADFDRLLHEARVAARLKHPALVTVYDVGRQPDGSAYIVMEYVAGPTLAQVLAARKLRHDQLADLVGKVAAAVHYAHTQGLVHRDLKPSNVLIGPTGLPQVADFGLAISEETQWLSPGQISGTPSYMAPEQVRGETHRLDGRTDVWALGVILYEALTGRLPFSGSQEQKFDEILHRDPKPPRQIDDTLPRELERICLKCLAKRMTERYTSAADLAEDLVAWRSDARVMGSAPAGGPTGGVTEDTTRRGRGVVPKGLRAFDSQDADFFLRLLPGPRDRKGLPEAVRFWKARAEEFDPDKTFSVGVLYGPSGCGKTSLVRAGLLPRLAPQIVPLYLEATPAGTEDRLMAALYRKFPGLPGGLRLEQALALVRNGRGAAAGEKLLLVIDQFEQWLHSHADAPNPELTRALRQCDGRRVQCLLMVRDDFWMAISGLMRDLEVRLSEGGNSAAIDLFGPRHARRVLFEFGRALGCLPADPDRVSSEQGRFLDQAVADLARGGKVSPVRLSLFTEMVKAREWSPETLKRFGGFEGLGVIFLEETFDCPTAPPGHRVHRQAVRAILGTLLPDRGTDIRGAARSRQDLLVASGYTREAEFDDLLHILDTGLRLVTPADPEVAGTAAGSPGYQLTHDYLVPSLREWLTRAQRRTWRGRAALALEERTAEWVRSRDRRFLPTLREYLAIRLGVPRSWFKGEQTALMRAAGRLHGSRCGLAVSALALVAIGVALYVTSVQRAAHKERAATLVEATLNAPPDGLPYMLADLTPFRDEAVPLLRRRLEEAGGDDRQRLHAGLALAELGEGDDDFLLESVVTAPDNESGNLIAALRRSEGPVREGLWERFKVSRDLPARARLAITLLHLGDAGAATRLAALNDRPEERTTLVHGLGSWRGDLSEVARVLRETDDGPLRSALCLALADLPPNQLLAAQRHDLEAALQEQYLNAPDGGTHSAAGVALGRWGAVIPAVARTARPAGGRGWFVNQHGLTLVRVPAGRFTMGDPGLPTAQPHEVMITRPFYLCDQEVTVALFDRLLEDPDYPAGDKPTGASPNRAVSPTGEHPAQRLSWSDAVRFCNWLSLKEGRRPCYTRPRREGKADGPGHERAAGGEEWECDFQADGYRLPTEAEWEYACRTGTASAYSFGDEEEHLGRYGVFARSHSAPVASKLPNPWGLFDMHGNVREWCWDRYQKTYPTGPASDPTGPDAGASRVVRGGSWYDHGRACRSPERNASPATFRDSLVGFRVACGE